ncbi:(2Fe-2S) ferredoxin domain-containing protein [Phormidium yuhuli AB48]|uniref:(2Fe-2S) ferredoxin domain-containing protein n=1 Tax=Phormidium yuhuli AB48 TaxID=2940671 RepID=A0ABY5AUR4_9CYAN|nr:(2Fe-2S) ferredoxin domain-containing protein [Phormidium yuhuli]USR92998.1 (2Fe-2S) ferredoxin domain-containing protein [Phormidium yuhuli AB48]
MSSCKRPFHLVGRVLSLSRKSKGQIKALYLLNEEGTHRIKLSSSLRSQPWDLEPGIWIAVQGTEKYKAKDNTIKRKAQQIQAHPGLRQLSKPGQGAPCPALEIQGPQSLENPPDPKAIKAPAGKILVCQKSKCRKRGGADLCKLLKQKLDEQGLGDSIQVQATGCLKRCKSAPNLVVLPQKARYSDIKPKEIPALLDQHFG